MRLVDAEALLLKALEEKRFIFAYEDMMSRELVMETVYHDLAEFILSAPVIDAEPVRHGRWEDGGWMGTIRCYYFNSRDGDRRHLCEHTPLNCEFCHCNELKHKRAKKCSSCGEKEMREKPYCPNCGAKMDLEDERDETILRNFCAME